MTGLVVALLIGVTAMLLWRRHKRRVARNGAPDSAEAVTAATSTATSDEEVFAAWAARAKGANPLKPTIAAEAARPSRPLVTGPPHGSAGGDMLMFTYCDADGVLTNREVLNWQDEGEYFTGFCVTRSETRTFRFDRVVEWKIGPDRVRRPSPSTQRRRPSADPPARMVKPSIVFTGFAKGPRAELERLAVRKGFEVRASVGATLDILCVGSSPGPGKLKSAEEHGVEIITERQFRDLAS